MIKSHLFDLKRSSVWHEERQRTQSSGDEENILLLSANKNRMRSQGS